MSTSDRRCFTSGLWFLRRWLGRCLVALVGAIVAFSIVALSAPRALDLPGVPALLFGGLFLGGLIGVYADSVSSRS